MNRSGYSDDFDAQQTNLWRGAVASAIRGKRGQAFLKEMLAAFDALPEKKLIARELEAGGCVCALGAVGRARGLDMREVDPDDYERVATRLGMVRALAQEIMWENDEGAWRETPEQRFERMRRWVQSQLAQRETEAK